MNNILITGKPKSGKSTLLKSLVNDIPNKVGFVTNEVLNNGQRVGFEMETYEGRKETLASTSMETKYKVSRYFVSIENLDSIISDVSVFDKDDLLYIDEIGQMELYSESFKDLVRKYLNAPNVFVATLSAVYEDELIKEIKERDDVEIIEINIDNREEKKELIRDTIQTCKQ